MAEGFNKIRVLEEMFWKDQGGQSEGESLKEDCGGGTGIDDRIWGSSSQPGATYP